ncbi:MAG: FmdB family zinc ribbon protein [Syntrophales bacterium]
MPTYEYICMDCKEKMEIFASIDQKEKGLDLKCSKCGGLILQNCINKSAIKVRR